MHKDDHDERCHQASRQVHGDHQRRPHLEEDQRDGEQATEGEEAPEEGLNERGTALGELEWSDDCGCEDETAISHLQSHIHKQEQGNKQQNCIAVPRQTGGLG